jgi:hypothetical protein
VLTGAGRAGQMKVTIHLSIAAKGNSDGSDDLFSSARAAASARYNGTGRNFVSTDDDHFGRQRAGWNLSSRNPGPSRANAETSAVSGEEKLHKHYTNCPKLRFLPPGVHPEGLHSRRGSVFGEPTFDIDNIQSEAAHVHTQL